MEACKECGYPVPAVVVGKGYRVMCPACGKSTDSYYRESQAVAEWEQMNKAEPAEEPKPKKEPKKGKGKN